MTISPRMAKPRPAQDLVDPRAVDAEAGELSDIGVVEVDGGGRGQGVAGDADLRRLAAAQLQDQPGGQLQAGDQALRVHAAGEAVLGVRRDAGVAAGLGGADRVEPGALDEDVGGGLRAAGALAAHDPAQADGAAAARVGDDAHLGADVVGLAVQRDQLLVVVFGRRGRGAGVMLGRAVAKARLDDAARPAGPAS